MIIVLFINLQYFLIILKSFQSFPCLLAFLIFPDQNSIRIVMQQLARSITIPEKIYCDRSFIRSGIVEAFPEATVKITLYSYAAVSTETSSDIYNCDSRNSNVDALEFSYNSS